MKLSFRVFVIDLVLVFFVAACGGGGGSDGDNSGPPANILPSAVIDVASTTGYAPLTVEFAGTSSSDLDGSISTYTWHMGDGSSYSGSSVSHTYTTLGTFSATLTVTDNDGASSSSSVSIKVHAQAAGPYYGDICSNVTGECLYAWGIIGSDHRIFLEGWNYSNDAFRIIAGSVNVNEDLLTGTLLAEIFDPYVFLDGTQLGNLAVEGIIDAKSGVDGSYTGVGDVGAGYLNYNTPIDGPASLEKIAGTWSWSDGLGYTETMIVDPDGSFTSSDTDGCTLNGRFSLMDAKRNEYDIEYDLSCPPGLSLAGDGRRKGLALIDDYYENDVWLYWSIIFQDGPMAGRAGGSSLARPRDSVSSKVMKSDAQQSVKSLKPHRNSRSLR